MIVIVIKSILKKVSYDHEFIFRTQQGTKFTFEILNLGDGGQLTGHMDHHIFFEEGDGHHKPHHISLWLAMALGLMAVSVTVLFHNPLHFM